MCGDPARCTDAQTDPRHFEACGAACPASPAATAECAAVRCGVACAAGFADCDGDASNGCEASLDSATTCGARVNRVCQVPPSFRSCRDILVGGASTGDSEYEIDPDGPGGAAPFRAFCDMTTGGGGWTRCLRVQNTSAADLMGNAWFDSCVTLSGVTGNAGNVLLRLRDGNGAEAYATTGNRVGTWSFDAITSTKGPSRQYDFNTHNQAITLANGDRMMISARNAVERGCWGSMGNGYSVVVYSSSQTDFIRPKLMVLPYLNGGDTNPHRPLPGRLGAP